MNHPGGPPLGRSNTYAYHGAPPDPASWYAANPQASPYTQPGYPPGPLHHEQTWPPHSSSTFYSGYPSGPHASHSASPCYPPAPLRHDETWSPHPSSVSRTCLPLGKLYISILKARGIKGDEWMKLGKADPFAKIKLGGKNFGREVETPADEDAGSNPEWNQLFTFFVLSEDTEYNELKISLYNRNTSPRAHNFLGHLTILNMGEIMSGRQSIPEAWYPVIRNGKQRGEILLSFDMISMSAHDILKSSSIREPSRSACSASSGGMGYKISYFSTSAQVILQGASLVIAIIAL